VSPPSAVASAFGLGCDWQAPTGVVESVDTLIVTEACAAILSSEQVSTLLAMEQVPWLAVAVVQVSPPLPGRASVNFTFMAEALPVTAGLLTAIEKLAWFPMVNVPPLGDLMTFNCAGGGVQESEPESVAVSPPSAVASAFGFGCD